MRKTSLLGFALLLACGTAQASEWVSIGKAADAPMEWLVDIDSIRISGHQRHAWFKTILGPHSFTDPFTNSQKWVSLVMQLQVFDCDAETVQINAITAYYEDGTNASMPDDSKTTPKTPVAPDTALDKELKFLCSWKPK